MLTIDSAEELRTLRVRLQHVQRAQRRIAAGRPGDAAALAREAQRLEDEIAQLLRWHPELKESK